MSLILNTAPPVVIWWQRPLSVISILKGEITHTNDGSQTSDLCFRTDARDIGRRGDKTRGVFLRSLGFYSSNTTLSKHLLRQTWLLFQHPEKPNTNWLTDHLCKRSKDDTSNHEVWTIVNQMQINCILFTISICTYMHTVIAPILSFKSSCGLYLIWQTFV